MEIDDDDDFYAPEEPETIQAPAPAVASSAPAAHHDEDLEEGEEEDEGAEMDEDDSVCDSTVLAQDLIMLTTGQDIDIITERKDGTQAPPPTQAKYSDIRNIPQRTTSSDTALKPVVKKEEDKSTPGAELPALSTSKIDVHAIPIHKGTGKPITQVNIDEGMSSMVIASSHL
jgi:pre-mRNA 3'-end-processing factor FIP1